MNIILTVAIASILITLGVLMLELFLCGVAYLEGMYDGRNGAYNNHSVDSWQSKAYDNGYREVTGE